MEGNIKTSIFWHPLESRFNSGCYCSSGAHFNTDSILYLQVAWVQRLYITWMAVPSSVELIFFVYFFVIIVNVIDLAYVKYTIVVFQHPCRVSNLKFLNKIPESWKPTIDKYLIYFIGRDEKYVTLTYILLFYRIKFFFKLV